MPDYKQYSYRYETPIQNRISNLEKENARLRDVLEFLDSAIKPDKRNYDRYGYCNIHKSILMDFEKRIKEALRR